MGGSKLPCRGQEAPQSALRAVCLICDQAHKFGLGLRWKDADRQFQLLTRDRVRVGVFGGRANFEARRRLAASRGR